jgi:hypothetical protein
LVTIEADAREQLANVVLDFSHDPSRRGPAVRLIVEALVPDERRATGPTRRPKQEVLDRQLQVLVGRDADGVLDGACLQRLVDLQANRKGDGWQIDNRTPDRWVRCVAESGTSQAAIPEIGPYARVTLAASDFSPRFEERVGVGLLISCESRK